MKKAFYLTALLGLLFSCSQTDEPEVMTQDEPTAETRGLFTKNVVISTGYAHIRAVQTIANRRAMRSLSRR